MVMYNLKGWVNYEFNFWVGDENNFWVCFEYGFKFYYEEVMGEKVCYCLEIFVDYYS